MGKIIYPIFWTILNILLARGQQYTPVIETASGPIRGLILTSLENKSYAAFKGIPYAKPPIDELRFKPPVPIDSWANVYNATSDGNMCIQVSFWDDKSILGSEDCLYMNVYTPHTVFNDSISKTVMVWFHGTRYDIGDAGQSMYSPDFLIGQDVIIVSSNHRLGAFGFLNLGHENATGNFALKDQNLALKWVKRNIANFGGDPDKITIFGESAGAVSVDLHVLSDMSVGLFNQSISMSGSTLNLYWGLQRRSEALANGFILGAKLGTYTLRKDVLLKTLHKASAGDIVTAVRTMGLIPFRPTLENPDIATDEEKFLTICSVRKYEAGNYTKGPHMMSFTSDESLFFAGDVQSALNTTSSILQSIRNTTSKIPLLSTLTNAFTQGIENSSESAAQLLAQKVSSIGFALGIDAKQQLISKNNDYPIYYYRFSFTPDYSFHKVIGVTLEGAGHADEMPYLFDMSTIFGNSEVLKFPSNQPDVALTRRRLVKLYTNFAKYGNPTPNGEYDELLGVKWPDSRPDGVHLEIGQNLTIGPRPTDELVKVLQILGLGKSSYFNNC